MGTKRLKQPTTEVGLESEKKNAIDAKGREKFEEEEVVRSFNCYGEIK